ncbi:FAD/NAD(P)-binding protein [Halorubrum alkaliphilum]|uniref:FAD/NAD(P)-binding protein n=1 Tax=Halorubrum alkaliphilum TaxID=261290 RepID=UPI001FD74B0F
MNENHPNGGFDCVILGGGIHGTHLAGRLIEDAGVDRHAVAVVDPNDRLLSSFRRKANAIGMDALRSTYVQHVGTEPFSLESFAEATGREDELRPTVDYPDRPSLDLFLDHADRFIDSNGLDSLHRQARVERIERGTNGELQLETSTGRMDTAACVLAIGHGGRNRVPDWARGVDGIDHVWGDFDPEADATRTIVVGGGITAVQLACVLSERESVTMVSRHPLEWEVSEADPPWLNWNHIERELHQYPRASKARLDAVRDAGHSATVPPYLYEPLDAQIGDGRLRLLEGDIETATTTEGGVALRLQDGEVLKGDRVVCATGFEPAFQQPFTDRLAADLDLARGYRGLPMLIDETLAWETTDGAALPLYVSGALALGVVGPYAPNIPGAKRAADRITRAVEARRVEPTNTPVRAE